jgi:hypothetical protein
MELPGMRSRRVLAIAVLAALPFTVTVAGAAPAGPNAGSAVSKVDTRGLVIDVRKGGHGGHGHGGHGHGGGHGHHGGGHGGHGHGGHGHWHGGHGHHGHGWGGGGGYGVPYYGYYGGSAYYEDDYYYDDGDDDAVVYAERGYARGDDAIERCETRYRSFDRRSGTFLANDGRRKLCPYLR